MSDNSQIHMAIIEHTMNPNITQVEVDQTMFVVMKVTDFNYSL